jgi:hypothetical protein
VHPDEILDGPVIRSLILFRKKTCRKLTVLSVVVETLTTVMFPFAMFICTGAVFLVRFRNAFH